MIKDSDVVITEIVSLGKENISTLATCFAKHSEKVCKKYFVLQFSEREAARISWSCYDLYKPDADIRKAVKFRDSARSKVPVPSTETIKSYLGKIINKVKLLTNITIEDNGLTRELERLALHEDGWYFSEIFFMIVMHMGNAYETYITEILKLTLEVNVMKK